jgi:hypothetical protein
MTRSLRLFIGRVQSGVGYFSIWMKVLSRFYREKTGVELFPVGPSMCDLRLITIFLISASDSKRGNSVYEQGKSIWLAPDSS